MQDPLDPVQVAALLPGKRPLIEETLDRVARHLELNQGYVAWSGGRDSTCVVDLARQVQPQVPVVWFDSGLEFPDNRDYIMGLGRQWELNLHCIAAEPDALTVLERTGAWDHRVAYCADAPDLHQALITGPAERAHALFGPGELSGLRAQESVGRRALLAPGAGAYSRKDGTCVYAPVWAWRAKDVRAYLQGQGIPESPVYRRLADAGAPERAQRVGLVVDGNNPEHGRYSFLRLAYPDVWAQLCRTLPRLREWR